ncbi:MAG TPA: NUDIX domain-containing protein [Aestuariivirga sp.]
MLTPILTVRVRLILLCGEHVLLAYDKEDEVYFLPGGGLEHGESAAACVHREINEECDLELPPNLRPFGLIENQYSRGDRDIHELLIHFTGELFAAPPAVASREPRLEFSWHSIDKPGVVIWPHATHNAIIAARRGHDHFFYEELQ